MSKRGPSAVAPSELMLTALSCDCPAHYRAALVAVILVLATFMAPGDVLAHISVQPSESAGQATLQYTIAVPSEKPLATVRVEVQFPQSLLVTQLEAPAGWRVAPEVSGGQILGAVWDGGSIPLGQFATFRVLAQNPTGPAELVWSVIQTYEDGSEVQWTGAEDAQFPATRTRVQGAAERGLSDIFATTALVAAALALVVGVITWRRVVRMPQRL